MLHYRLLLLILITCINSYAQNIQGKVVDELTGTGIPFVSIGVMGTNNATVSNENGEFILKSANFPVKLRYSHVSYFTADQEVTSPSTTLLVKLKPAAINLNMVTVDPYKGLRILKAALEKAKVNENLNFYGNAFYRQLTSLNDRPSQIYELFYDLELNARKVKGWIAKQSRFAELNEKIAFSLNNQSYLTFTFGGYLLPEKTGKFVNLNNLKDFDITVEKYIEQTNQDIAVISCKYKGSNKKQYYTNSTYYIGVEDSKIYRLENSAFNLPIKLTGSSAKIPPILTTIATFSDKEKAPISILESVSTKLFISLNINGTTLNPLVTSLLTVYKIDKGLNQQKFTELTRNVKDKNVIESIAYDPEFWKNNPIVKQTTLEDSFIKMMESKLAFGTMITP